MGGVLGVGPESDDLAFFSVMYPHVPPELLPEALDAHPRVSDLLTRAGGKRYGPDWMGEVDHDGWRTHFGRAHEGWINARRTFDPNCVFRSTLVPNAD
jgi:hypothetical protein